MNSEIVTSPKIYLDTAHVVNIARLRNGEPVDERYRDAYALIDECITQRHFGLIFNPAAALEWLEGRATLRSAHQLADVFDSAKLVYCLEIDSVIFTAELLRECSRIHPGLNAPDLPILQVYEPGKPYRNGLGILADAVPGYFDGVDLLPHLRDVRPPKVFEAPPLGEYVRRAHHLHQTRPDVCQEPFGSAPGRFLRGTTRVASPQIGVREMTS